MNPVTGLSLGRIVIGLVSIVAPALAGRLFGVNALDNPQLPVFSRLFGAREIALGAATLAASGAAQRNLILAGIAVDAADAATGVVSTNNQQIGRVSGGLLTAVALGAVGSGIAALILGRGSDA